MKPISCIEVRNAFVRLELRPLILLLVSVFLHSVSEAQPVLHEVTPLPGFASSSATGINNSAVVCGKSYTNNDDDIAQLWTTSGGSTVLPSLFASSESVAWGINDSGQVTGMSRNADGFRRGVVWANAASIAEIGTLTNQSSGMPGNESEGYALNNDGTITGYSEIPNAAGDFTPFHAISYTAGAIADLGTLNTTAPEDEYGYSMAYDITSTGKIVGIAHDDDFNYRPFIHDHSGMHELPIDSAHAEGEWYATTLNDNDLIGGVVILSDTQTLPYYWPDAAADPLPVPLPTAFPNGEIYSINEDGQMVGLMWSNDAEPLEHAFIFDTVFGLRDLNDLIDPTAGWTLNYAIKINDNGLIVGSGVHLGNQRGYLLDSLSLNFDGDVNNDGTIDLQDIIRSLQVAAGLTESPVNRYADVNGDDRVGLAEALFAAAVNAGL